MQRQVKEKIATPAKAPRSVNANTINIPMNKVNELKKKLNDSKAQELKKLESAQMNAKKRAEIKERVNTVQGLLKGLNDGTLIASASVNKNKARSTPAKELNLPRARVSEMKSWLKEFEKDNKAHADKWNTPGFSSAGKGGAYIPKTGTRNDTFSGANSNSNAGPFADHTNTQNVEYGQSEGKRVSELTEWLVGFGQGNKAHFQNGFAKADTPGRRFPRSKGTSLVVDQDAFDVHVQEEEQADEQEQEQEQVFEEVKNSEEAQPVENISMLEQAESDNTNLNISMMPGAPNATNVYEDDGCKDWEDEYQDLMMTVDIQQVESADSWDKESIVSPRDFIEEEGEATLAQDAMDFHQKEEEQSVDTTNSGGEDEESIDEVEESIDEVEESIDEVEESIDEVEGILNETMDEDIAKETIDQDISVASSTQSSQIEEASEQEIELTFDCDDTISRMSFEGQPVEHVSAADFAHKTNQEVSSAEMEDDSTSLEGEYILNKTTDPIVSTSVFGHGLSDSIAQPNAMVQKKKKKSGLRKFMSSLNCLKINKASKAAEMFANTAEETKKPSYDQKKASSKSLFLSPDSHQDEDDVQNSYLPNTYNNDNFAREMIIRKNNRMLGPVAESPVSLASAYRRQLSPDSSCVSGFTDVDACVMMKKHDIGQHVKHLQGLYDSPVTDTKAQRGDVKLLHMF